jgi:dTDP-4-dehydrorhamnose 3,5-epimerase
MKRIDTDIPGLVIIEPKVFGDDRGFFFESYNQQTFARLGIDTAFVQDNHSRSAAGVLRGLHYQIGANAQDKLVRVSAGAVFDVGVDLRRTSPTFGRWFGVELSAMNKRMLLLPKGLAHGFVSLVDGTEFLYKCSAPYDPASERGVAWDDPGINIAWPLNMAPTLSERDRRWPTFAHLRPEDLF